MTRLATICDSGGLKGEMDTHWHLSFFWHKPSPGYDCAGPTPRIVIFAKLETPLFNPDRLPLVHSSITKYMSGFLALGFLFLPALGLAAQS
jgi:hypothetical protein